MVRTAHLRIAFVALACAAASACGGLLALPDGGPLGETDAGGADRDGSLGDAADVTVTGAGSAADAGIPCSDDASDDVLCIPPPNDLLDATPPAVSIAAGSYGVVTFTATGPWVNDPKMYMHYEGTTLEVLNDPQVQTYGSPQSLLVLVAEGTAGHRGTLTVSGHAGNIKRTAVVSIDVTACVPWPVSSICVGNDNCGFQPDGCGGLLSCGTCSGEAPYCFLNTCVSTPPQDCPDGYGLGGNGACVPCGMTKTCKECGAGSCIGKNDLCICEAPASED